MSVDYLGYFETRQRELLERLRECVEFESPSLDKAATDRLGTWLGEQLRAVGASVEFVDQPEFGKHVIGTWGTGSGHILILGHYDTVWPVGELLRRPFQIDGQKAFGPGVFDMKIGDVQILYALRALGGLGVDVRNRVTVVFNSDEEVGSPTSRPVIERLASQADCVFVLEPSVPPNGALKTSRKGVGIFHLELEGRAAHAGADHASGISAIQELAHQVLDLHAMTNYDTGTTVNVGVVKGGSRSNVVAARASAEIDLRVVAAEAAREMEEAILGLKPHDPGVKLTVTGGLNRPPMERTEQIVSLFNRARAFAHDLGFDVDEASSGGGSDGNFTAALGVPTLDGLGGVGSGGHAIDEHIIVDEVPRRAALLTKLIAEL